MWSKDARRDPYNPNYFHSGDKNQGHCDLGAAARLASGAHKIVPTVTRARGKEAISLPWSVGRMGVAEKGKDKAMQP